MISILNDEILKITKSDYPNDPNNSIKSSNIIPNAFPFTVPYTYLFVRQHVYHMVRNAKRASLIWSGTRSGQALFGQEPEAGKPYLGQDY